MKKISVIIPCYNVEKEIDRCIQSLVDQTILLSQMELIFVDDASEDATMEKLSKWEEQYPESILVIHCEENRGRPEISECSMPPENISVLSIRMIMWSRRCIRKCAALPIRNR